MAKKLPGKPTDPGNFPTGCIILIIFGVIVLYVALIFAAHNLQDTTEIGGNQYKYIDHCVKLINNKEFDKHIDIITEDGMISCRELKELRPTIDFYVREHYRKQVVK